MAESQKIESVAVAFIRREIDCIAALDVDRTPEAVIFYASRILEATARDNLEFLGIGARSNCFESLQVLEGYHLIESRAVLYWTHGLRRLGNSVRHLLDEVNAQDARMAIVMLDRWLATMAAPSDRRPSFAAESAEDRRSMLARIRNLDDVLDDVAFVESAIADQDREQGIEARLEKLRSIAVRRPSMAPCIAEALIDRSEKEVACALGIIEATRKHPASRIRLIQLEALAQSREKKYVDAIATISSLRKGSQDPDAETAGIRGGIIKRQYFAEKDPLAAEKQLRHAHDVYLTAFERGGSRVAYLGVNAAATAYWLGASELASARELAKESLEIVEKRLTKAREKKLVGDLYFWDQWTIAECRLILGDIEAARDAYVRAMLITPQKSDQVFRSALGQLERHLRNQMIPLSDFLGKVRIGVTGHRTFVESRADVTSKIESRVRARLAPWRHIPTLDLPKIHLTTALASGADRFAVDALRDTPGFTYEALLPMEPDEYREDFSDAEKEEFDLYRRAAAQRTVIKGAHDRKDAYERCGQRIAENCDLLLAVWDGLKSRGRGGTGDIHEFARMRGIPIEPVGVLPRDEKPDE